MQEILTLVDFNPTSYSSEFKLHNIMSLEKKNLKIIILVAGRIARSCPPQVTFKCQAQASLIDMASGGVNFPKTYEVLLVMIFFHYFRLYF